MPQIRGWPPDWQESPSTWRRINNRTAFGICILTYFLLLSLPDLPYSWLTSKKSGGPLLPSWLYNLLLIPTVFLQIPLMDLQGPHPSFSRKKKGLVSVNIPSLLPKLSKTLKSLRYYSAFKLTWEPATDSWMLAEDIRVRDKGQFIIHSSSSSKGFSIFAIVP